MTRSTAYATIDTFLERVMMLHEYDKKIIGTNVDYTF